MRDMTRGSIPGHMLAFTLPILMGNLLQQLYNLTNSIIVGQFVGKVALAAADAAGAVMNVLLFLMVGITMGASVVLSERFGAGESEQVRSGYQSALVAGGALTVVISLLGMLFAPQMLLLIHTPAEALPQASAYLRVLAGALLFSFAYNLSASALRAIGDSRAPLLFLALSVGLNVLLALVFVAALHMGVEGAAWATAVAQALSALCCFAYIQWRAPILRLARGRLVDGALLARMGRYAGVCGVQQVVLYAGRLFVQGAVNGLTLDGIAAYNGANKIDGIVVAPTDALSTAQTTFASQNIGAGEPQRARRALRLAIGAGLLFCLVSGALVYGFAGRLMGAFLPPEETVATAAGVQYLTLIAPFYLLTALCNGYQGLFRGLGRMDLALGSTLIQIPVRVVLSNLLAPRMGLPGVALATGIGWAGMVIYAVTAEQWIRRRAAA